MPPSAQPSAVSKRCYRRRGEGPAVRQQTVANGGRRDGERGWAPVDRGAGE